MAEKAKVKEVVVEEELEPEVMEYGALDYMQESIADLLSRADVSAAFGEPVEHGETLIIPAAEVVAGLGMGVGRGSGGGEQGGQGDGGGGGGRAFSRPVAVIIAEPNGVRVEPVVDPTKIAMAFFTTLGFIFAMIARIRRGPRHHHG
jgi:uncharacterized spore protein YtfJ